MNSVQIIAFFTLMFIFAGCDQKDDMQDAQEPAQFVSNRIIQESIKRYEIVKKSDNPMDACLQAGMIKNTMLAIQNETEYLKWQTIEKDDCKKARIHN